MEEKIKEFFRRANDYGIPIPMLRDPESDRASVSLTMVFISFNVVLVGLIGKASGFLGGINLEQAIYWFMVCCGLYFGRKVTSGKDGTNLEQKKKDESNE
jgi:hypothetical protein